MLRVSHLPCCRQRVNFRYRICTKSNAAVYAIASLSGVRTITSGTTNGIKWFNSHCTSVFRHAPNTCWTVVPLGTSSAVPSPRRNVTATYLRMLSEGYLFDAGEGTFSQLRACYLCSLRSLRRIFITHMHGDHVFGLPSLLMYSLELARTYSAGGRDLQDLPRLQVYGPLGLYNYLRTAFMPAGRRGWESMPVDIFELVPRVTDEEYAYRTRPPQAKNHRHIHPEADGSYRIVDEDDHTVIAAPLQHSIACYGYVIQEKEKRRMIPDRLMKLGIPPGPLYSRIQAGESIRAPDGTPVTWEDVSFATGPGRKVVILGDNCDASHMVPHALDADLVTHECTIVDDDEAKAKSRGHSTARMAGAFANACRAKALLLTHFSSSYGCSLREASIHWLGRTEASKTLKQASTAPRAHDSMFSADRTILSSEADVLQEAQQQRGARQGKQRGLQGFSRHYGTMSNDDMPGLPSLMRDEIEYGLTSELDFSSFDSMDAVSPHQALLDGVFETDRIPPTTLQRNVAELLSSRKHRTVHMPIQLSSCSFPEVRDVESMQSLVNRAAKAAPNTRIIAARDFMAIPIEGSSKTPTLQ